MCPSGIKPSLLAFNILLASYNGGHQWLKALLTMDSMQHLGMATLIPFHGQLHSHMNVSKPAIIPNYCAFMVSLPFPS